MCLCMRQKQQFESSVNSYGRKTNYNQVEMFHVFESSVNSYGRKTDLSGANLRSGLRVV